MATSGLDRMRNDAVLAFLHLDLGRPADPDYRYAARQLGQPLLSFSLSLS